MLEVRAVLCKQLLQLEGGRFTEWGGDAGDSVCCNGIIVLRPFFERVCSIGGYGDIQPLKKSEVNPDARKQQVLVTCNIINNPRLCMRIPAVGRADCQRLPCPETPSLKFLLSFHDAHTTLPCSQLLHLQPQRSRNRRCVVYDLR